MTLRASHFIGSNQLRIMLLSLSSKYHAHFFQTPA
jgi:hypothetical protein